MSVYTRKVRLTGKSAKEIYDKISQDIDQWSGKIGLPNVKFKKDPEAKKVEVHSPMFNITLVCVDGEARLDGKLGMLALPFRSRA